MTQATVTRPRRRPRVGKFEILRHIAAGGMGAVYRAYDTVKGREVALKVLAPELAARADVRERFRREAQSAARLRHPHIVAIYECGRTAGTWYLAFEFVDGMDLGEYLRQNGKLEPAEALPLVKQAAQALRHLHEKGLVHRDIKPSNFLLTFKDGQPLLKLTDLGLARHVRHQELRLTRIGTTVGTVDYLSPEQARDSARADIRSDIYSLGCTLFHLLAGQPPFADGSMTERLCKHLQAPPPDLRSLNPAVCPELVAILQRMLEKKPEARFQTPDDLLAALEQLTLPARPPAFGRDNPPARETIPTTQIFHAADTMLIPPPMAASSPIPTSKSATPIDKSPQSLSETESKATHSTWWLWAVGASLVVLGWVLAMLFTQR